MKKPPKKQATDVETVIKKLKKCDYLSRTKIRNACVKYNVSEKHIRNIAGW